MHYQNEHSPIKNVSNSLGKDIRNKKITGVCAGIAKYWDIPRFAVRAAALVALIIFPVITLTAYVVASMLLPNLLPSL